MQILSNISLADHSTMRLGGTAHFLVEVHTKDELVQAIEWATHRRVPILCIGDGSNIIFQDGYDGLVVINHITGREVVQEDAHSSTLVIGAGEPWDAVVQWSVELNLSGIEKLSLIPGTAGATPVQNVGAYGAEIADTFVELEAYDLQANRFVTISRDECHFGYRTSIFKSLTDRRYIITSMTLKLSKQPPQPPFYETLSRYLDEHHITTYTPQTIRDAVIAIRRSKLPDPAAIANTGSFFKNPLVSQEVLESLQQRFDQVPHWPAGSRVKLSAGWLISQAGLKDYAAHGMKLYEHNALVFVNDHAKSYADLVAFKQEVIDRVEKALGITLEQEPELV